MHKFINLAILPMAMLAVFSCTPKDQPDDKKPDPKTPAPVISKVTATEDLETAISEASLNQSITVFGENFGDLESVTINNISVDLRSIYAQETRLDLIVPRQIPSEVNDKLTVTTKGGSAQTNLHIILPKLVINGFKNDFAADEEEVEITGENFDLYQIDKENATLKFNGAPIDMIACTDKSFTIKIPAGTPWPNYGVTPWGQEELEARNHVKNYGEPSYLEISSPGIKSTIKVPFREQGISILTNDLDTWWSGWWPTGIIQAPFTECPLIADITPYYLWVACIKMNFAEAWQYENVTYIHWWLPEAAKDVADNPDKYVIKMEILNPSTTPLAKYMRIGSALVEANDGEHFLMWDPASVNDGVALNTMGKWQTLSFEVTDLFYPLEDGKKSSLVTTTIPATTFDDENTFKIAMQREDPGDVEFYFWNIRIVKKLEYTY